MRELKGEKDLQLAKDVLCAFEEAHYPNKQACSDIQKGLYWCEEAEDEYYSADLGQLLREECEEVRIFEYEEEDDWLTKLVELIGWYPAAFVRFNNKLYFFCI